MSLNLKSDSALYKRLLQYLKPYKTRFTIGMLASIPAAALDGAAAWAVGPLLDKLLKTHDYSMLLYIPLMVVGASVIQGVSFYISTYCNNYVGTAISRDIRTQLFGHLSHMELRYFKRKSSGDLYARYVSDPGILQAAIVNNLQDFIIQLFSFSALAAVLISRNWMFAILSILIISMIIIPLQVISKKIRKLDHESNDNLGQMVSVFAEAISQAKLMIGYQLENYQRKRFKKSLDMYFNISMRMLKAGTWLKPMMQIIASIGIGAIIVFGALQVQAGTMTPGNLASFLLALILLYKPVKTLASIMGKLQRILAPAERVFEKLDIQPQLMDPINPVILDKIESLTFRDLCFEYETGIPVLKNINLAVSAGEVIALVGPSGAGKSTLVDLIPRFMDTTSGQVLLNNVDIQSVSLNWLRSQMAIVSQDALLIDTTIRENVLLGRLSASDEEVWDALRAANLEDFVKASPLGLETRVGQLGGYLSGGQRQRVAIARAFLRDAPILIMDEATSALDNESEAKVQDALMKIMQGRTVFVIAHRLSTIQCANRIIVMDHGKIVEMGSHKELLKTEGLYSRLYNLQFRYTDQQIISVPEPVA
jgi:subfamily B ATP-binding cassette protein MsbA